MVIQLHFHCGVCFEVGCLCRICECTFRNLPRRNISVFALTVGLVAVHSFLSNPSIINVHDAIESQPLHRNQTLRVAFLQGGFWKCVDAALINM